MRSLKWNAFLLLSFLLPLNLAQAQASLGNIRGEVTDQENIPLPAVLLELLQDKQPLKQTVSDENGQFFFPNVQVGTYSVHATLAAFKPATVEDVRVLPGGSAMVKMQLKLEGGEMITVSSEVPVLDSTDHSGTSDFRQYPASGKKKESLSRLGYVGNSWATARVYDRVGAEPNTEAYDRVEDNGFVEAKREPLSTFAIDVDTASYANVRRFIEGGRKPPKDAVRLEELLNYFPYAYAAPTDGAPFGLSVEVGSAPWSMGHRLVRLGLKGRELELAKRPPMNLVFLVDVSGSMDEPNKLPLVVESLRMLAVQLGERDRVAIVVYAGASGLALAPTRDKRLLIEALEKLRSGGSTNGGAGIELAYKVAQEGFIEGGVNRVLLCTDGDFNVGVSSESELMCLIKEKAKGGVFLSVLGFGMGNYKDATLEKLADKGNGNYAYIDGAREARKALVEQMLGTLVTIAKDVKVQVEFNPRQVVAYRLLGYENRLLRAEDFKDDKKDAGEIGVGHTVTALYEVVPVGEAGASSGELLTVKLRYKMPEGDRSQELTRAVTEAGAGSGEASEDFWFTAAVAEFGMLLRDSPYKGSASYEGVLELGKRGKGEDAEGYRAEFLELVEKARGLK